MNKFNDKLNENDNKNIYFANTNLKWTESELLLGAPVSGRIAPVTDLFNPLRLRFSSFGSMKTMLGIISKALGRITGKHVVSSSALMRRFRAEPVRANANRVLTLLAAANLLNLIFWWCKPENLL